MRIARYRGFGTTPGYITNEVSVSSPGLQKIDGGPPPKVQITQAGDGIASIAYITTAADPNCPPGYNLSADGRSCCKTGISMGVQNGMIMGAPVVDCIPVRSTGLAAAADWFKASFGSGLGKWVLVGGVALAAGYATFKLSSIR